LYEIMYYEGDDYGIPILIATFNPNVQLTTSDFT
jgi:hypothetical protein